MSIASKLVSVMEQVGKDCLLALREVEKYLPSAAALASVIFPAQIGKIDAVVNATGLIQSAVVKVEQQMAAAGKSSGTGTQKAADVIAIVGPTVTQLLSAEGVKVDNTYIQKIIDAVVAILNVQQGAAKTTAGTTPALEAAGSIG